MSEISLTASMRSNLLSLQNIASRQDIVQNRLATGLKVSSAIDNPSSYYTASSLNNRAADLTALLDAMSQGIQTIKAASEAIDSGTKFLEQAKAVANQALETAQPVIARVSSEAELLAAIDSGQRGLIVAEGTITLSDNTSLYLKDGQSLVGARYLDKTAAETTINFNFTTSDSGNGIIVGNNSITGNLTINFNSLTSSSWTSFNAVLNDGKHNVSLENLNINLNKTEDKFSINGIGLYNGAETTISGNLNIKGNGDVTYRGIFSQNKEDAKTIYTEDSVVNIIMKGYAFYGGNHEMNGIINTNCSGIYASSICESILTVNGTVNLTQNGESAFGIVFSNAIINGNVNIFSKGNYGSALGVSNVHLTANARLNGELSSGSRAVLARVNLSWEKGANINYKKDGTEKFLLAVQNQKTPTAVDYISDLAVEFPGLWNSVAAPSAPLHHTVAEQLNDINNKIYQYSEIIKQYDMLISDASYKGINLLEGQYLKINFNEDRSSKIDVPGVKADSESLGLKTKEWKTAEDVEKSISELEEAIGSLRSFASEFGNYYSIVTTRQDFTENLINVLEEGADKLTLADMNQESANMLALQTAQQLAVNSLSLASQASQAVLKLF